MEDEFPFIKVISKIVITCIATISESRSIIWICQAARLKTVGNNILIILL